MGSGRVAGTRKCCLRFASIAVFICFEKLLNFRVNLSHDAEKDVIAPMNNSAKLLSHQVESPAKVKEGEMKK